MTQSGLAPFYNKIKEESRLPSMVAKCKQHHYSSNFILISIGKLYSGDKITFNC